MKAETRNKLKFYFLQKAAVCTSIINAGPYLNGVMGTEVMQWHEYLMQFKVSCLDEVKVLQVQLLLSACQKLPQGF